MRLCVHMNTVSPLGTLYNQQREMGVLGLELTSFRGSFFKENSINQAVGEFICLLSLHWKNNLEVRIHRGDGQDTQAVHTPMDTQIFPKT